MFSSFRDKFKAVQNDVILGFQRLTGPDPLPPGAPDGDDDVTALAGARLLSRYQNQWSQLHTTAERTVTAADALNKNICSVRDRCQREYTNMAEFHRRLTSLPEIAAKVHSMVATIASLQGEFAEAELQLAELEHRAALDKLEDRKMRERAKLEAYRRARQQQFDELQITAAQQHLQRASQEEWRRRSEQAERHSTFDQLAHQELEHFRRHQSLDVVWPVSSRPGPQLSLDEVDISREGDAAVLAAFLADTGLDPQDPARETELDPEDPARDFDSNPEDPARDTDSNPEDPAREIESNPEDPARETKSKPEGPAKEAELNPVGPARETELDPNGPDSDGAAQPSAP